MSINVLLLKGNNKINPIIPSVFRSAYPTRGLGETRAYRQGAGHDADPSQGTVAHYGQFGDANQPSKHVSGLGE